MTKLDRLLGFIDAHGFSLACFAISKDASRMYRSEAEVQNIVKQWETYTREGGNVFWDPVTQGFFRAIKKLPSPSKSS
jgi:hypothetical protein